MKQAPEIGDLRVWHTPQVPVEPFYVDVCSPLEAKRVIDMLARYDLFQYENKVKPDYFNASGLEAYGDLGRGNGGWEEWEDPDTSDDINEWQATA